VTCGIYSNLARELASHGCIMFLIEHCDGSSCYTERMTEKGPEPVHFDISYPLFTEHDMRKKSADERGRNEKAYFFCFSTKIFE
jgi:hypothetical protein